MKYESLEPVSPLGLLIVAFFEDALDTPTLPSQIGWACSKSHLLLPLPPDVEPTARCGVAILFWLAIELSYFY